MEKSYRYSAFDALRYASGASVAHFESGEGSRLVDSYLPHVDAVAYTSGHDSDPFHEEFGPVSAAVRDLLAGLDGETTECTLVASTADHGLFDTEPETNVNLCELDEVWNDLQRRTPDGEPVLPVGSGRNVHRFLEPASVESVRRAVERQGRLSDVHPRGGPGRSGAVRADPGDRSRERCGDLVVVPNEKTIRYDPRKLRGMHGGFSPAKMLVPLAVTGASELAADSG